MTTVLVLGMYALLVGFVTPPVLRHRWAQRLPRLAIASWLILSISFITSVVLAAVALAVPWALLWSPQVGNGARNPASTEPAISRALISVLGMVVVVGVILQVCRHLVRERLRSHRGGSQHEAMVAAVGRPDPTLGAVVLDHAAPAAYCLPGRCHRVVVTRGAVATLTPEQLQAVLAHERAHLHSHHHLIVGTAHALARALPWVPLLRQASDEVAVLAEMAADDAAARRHDRCTLADALMICARVAVRPMGLTAGGPAAATRVRRLLRPSRSPGPAGRVGLALGVAMLLIPVAVCCVPLVALGCEWLTR